MAHEQALEDSERLDNFNIHFIGMAATIIIATLVFALIALYRITEQKEHQVKVIEQPWQEFNSLKQSQLEELQDYGKIEETGEIQIPVDRAMELILRERNQD